MNTASYFDEALTRFSVVFRSRQTPPNHSPLQLQPFCILWYTPTMSDRRRQEIEEKRAKLAELRRARDERKQLLAQAEKGSGLGSAEVSPYLLLPFSRYANTYTHTSHWLQTEEMSMNWSIHSWPDPQHRSQAHPPLAHQQSVPLPDHLDQLLRLVYQVRQAAE